MFGKKKQPLSPYTLEILTLETLIDGTFDGNTSLYAGSQDEVIPISLTNAKIQPTGQADIPTRTCESYTVFGNNAMFIIPRTDVTQMDEYEFWKLFSRPMEGTFHLGHYQVRGRLMMQNLFYKSQMPMFDVRITSRLQGARWAGLEAPFGLINFHWLSGFEP